MGIYVNPGNMSFQEAINSKIYVDKSGLIPYTNIVIRTQQKNLCVSPPGALGNPWRLTCWWRTTAGAVSPPGCSQA